MELFGCLLNFFISAATNCLIAKFKNDDAYSMHSIVLLVFTIARNMYIGSVLEQSRCHFDKSNGTNFEETLSTSLSKDG